MNDLAFRRQQGGSTLIITLVLLIMITLMSVSAINTSMNINHIVANAQFKEEARAAGQQAVNQLISSITNSNSSLATVAQSMGTVNVDINQDGSGDYKVTLYTGSSFKPTCVAQTPFLTQDASYNALESRYTSVMKSATATATDIAKATASYDSLNNCVGKTGSGRDSAKTSLCYWTVWDVPAQVQETFTGTSVEIHQGVKVLVGIDTVANNCI